MTSLKPALIGRQAGGYHRVNRVPAGGCPHPAHNDLSSCPAGMSCARLYLCEREAARKLENAPCPPT